MRGVARDRIASGSDAKWIGIAAWIGAAAWIGGCGGGAAPQALATDPFPRGLVVAGSDLVCAPSNAWQVDDAGTWSFRGVAEVACGVVRTPPGDVVLAFAPAGDSRGFRFDVEWDGRPLADAATGGGRTDGTLRVVLGRELLAAGSHVLRLTRHLEPDDAARADNRFDGLGITLPGAAEAPFLTAAAERYAYLADLLVTGVTGTHGERAGFAVHLRLPVRRTGEHRGGAAGRAVAPPAAGEPVGGAGALHRRGGGRAGGERHGERRGGAAAARRPQRDLAAAPRRRAAARRLPRRR